MGLGRRRAGCSARSLLQRNTNTNTKNKISLRHPRIKEARVKKRATVELLRAGLLDEQNPIASRPQRRGATSATNAAACSSRSRYGTMIMAHVASTPANGKSWGRATLLSLIACGGE